MNTNDQAANATISVVAHGFVQGEVLRRRASISGRRSSRGHLANPSSSLDAIMPVRITGPESSFAWLGVLAIFVPNPLKPDRPNAGTLLSNKVLPALHLTLDVTQVQFSDIRFFLGAARLKGFHFTVKDRRDDHFKLTFLDGSVGTVIPQQTILQKTRKEPFRSRLVEIIQLQVVVLVGLAVAFVITGSPEALLRLLVS